MKYDGLPTLLGFLFLSVVAVWGHSWEMTDTHILPKWLYGIWVGGGVLLVASIGWMAGWREKKDERKLFLGVGVLCLLQALYAVGQAVGLFSSYFSYRVVGSFDNPAGLAACLCVGVPCGLYLLRTAKKHWERSMAVAVIGISTLALLLSGSRAGVLSVLVVLAVYVFRFHLIGRKVRVALLLVGVALLTAMYYVKKDSADGRLLMARVAWEMIKERLLTGHGPGAVEAHYMDYQAAYLAKLPAESRAALLADNVKHVFNEYLELLICYGLWGGLLWAVVVCFLWHCYRKTPSEEGRCAGLSLLSVAVLACFSYPLSYPFTWVMLLLCAWVLVYRAYPWGEWWWKKKVRYPLGALLLLLSIGMEVVVTQRIRAELEWGRIARLSQQGSGKQMLPRYERLLPIMEHEPYFLYNYAAELYLAGCYEQGLQVAGLCRTYWADYELQLLQGELLTKLNRTEEAETHYYHASRMCPSRFMPLYKLYKLYQLTGDTDKEQTIALQILEKPVKVNSGTVRRIKREVKKGIAD